MWLPFERISGLPFALEGALWVVEGSILQKPLLWKFEFLCNLWWASKAAHSWQILRKLKESRLDRRRDRRLSGGLIFKVGCDFLSHTLQP